MSLQQRDQPFAREVGRRQGAAHGFGPGIPPWAVSKSAAPPRECVFQA
jgi:hypothetical protein